MTSLKVFILGVLLGLYSIWSCDANPVKGLKQKVFRKNKYFNNELETRKITRCEDIMGSDGELKQFTDEIALGFLKSGNLNALDNLLSYLVELKCFTASETKRFRKELVTIYGLINKGNQMQINNDENLDINVGDVMKRSQDNFDRIQNDVDEVDHDQLNVDQLRKLTHELSNAVNNGHENSIEYTIELIESIKKMAKSNQLSIDEAKSLISTLEESLKYSTQNEHQQNSYDDNKPLLKSIVKPSNSHQQIILD